MKSWNQRSALLVGLIIGFVAVAACGDDAEKSKGDPINDETNNSSTNGSTNNSNNSTNGSTNSTNNSTNNQTNAPVPNYVILIKDVTSGDTCDGSDPGSDIIFATLEDGSGKILGWGTLKYDGITGDANEFNLGQNLNGTPPTFDICPEFAPEEVTSLGCGGSIGLMFLGPNGQSVAIEPGMDIRVSEYGDNCGGVFTDQFEVFVCTNTNEVVNNRVLTSCTKKLGGGSGEVTVSP